MLKQSNESTFNMDSMSGWRSVFLMGEKESLWVYDEPKPVEDTTGDGEGEGTGEGEGEGTGEGKGEEEKKEEVKEGEEAKEGGDDKGTTNQ